MFVGCKKEEPAPTPKTDTTTTTPAETPAK
jgi:hypothetical protein